METQKTIGSLSALWRFPIKSMQGERIEHAQVTERGILGDRAYALIDAATGKVVSAKNVKQFPGILECQATYIQQPQLNHGPATVQITLPDGKMVNSDSNDVDEVLSIFFRRQVRLAQAAPEDFTIDQYHPDLEDLDPAGYRDTVVEQKLGSAFFNQAGLPSPVPVESFFDLFPVTVLSTATLEQLSELNPKSHFDQRRFRMNLIIHTIETGFVENNWVGHKLLIGDSVRLNITMPDPRCVMTTLPQEELPKDNGILQTLTRHNRIQIGPAGRFPCAGVYAVVEGNGIIQKGDDVSLM